MTQHYMYFVDAQSNPEAAKRLIDKLVQRAGPGAILPLDAEEYKVLCGMKAVPIGYPPPAPEDPDKITRPRASVVTEEGHA